MKKTNHAQWKRIIRLFCSAIPMFLWSLPAAGQVNGPFFCPAGPVSKQVGMYSYRTRDLQEYTKTDSQGRRVKRISIQRDKHGIIVGKTHYDKNNEITLKLSYRFDDRGQLIKKIKRGPDRKPIKSCEYFYGPVTGVCRQVDVDPDGNVLKTHFYLFNHRGERVRKTTLNSRGNLVRTRVYLFDDSGKRIKDCTFSPDGDILGSTVYRYGKTGFITGIRYVDGSHKLKGSCRIELDGRDRPRRKHRFDTDGNLKYVLHYRYQTGAADSQNPGEQ